VYRPGPTTRRAGGEVFGAPAVGARVGVAGFGRDRVRLWGPDDRRPFSLRNDLAEVFPPAADSGGHQDPPQRLRRPRLAGRGRYRALVQVEAQRAQRIAGQHPARTLTDPLGLIRAKRPLVGLSAERP